MLQVDAPDIVIGPCLSDNNISGHSLIQWLYNKLSASELREIITFLSP